MTADIRYVHTAHGNLAYTLDGDPAAPAIVLCQRFRGTIDDWDPLFIDRMTATGRQVVRFDSAGVGRSTGTTPDTVSGMADVLLAFLDATELAPCDLLGWSMGGEVAQWAALKAPQKVRRLVLAGTSPGAVTEADPDPRVPEHARGKEVSAEDELFLFFGDSSTSAASGRRSIARTAAARTSPPVSAESVSRQAAASAAFQSGADAVRHRLHELRVPVLVANGTDDRMLPAVGSFIIATHVPDAKLVLYPDAGHGFLFQHVDGFVGEVARFLDADVHPTWS